MFQWLNIRDKLVYGLRVAGVGKAAVDRDIYALKLLAAYFKSF
ncbi:hypothetical protein APHNP_1473 [Anaplasma phagocytophilum str. ApNP]|uniref:Uncharacterized protein n=2 Tax=Anaplasma phagocytophilum TaxID=948 RepID=A0A0F3NHA8_ANAPH|nr:hypothetical protein APHMUC_1620 [Anaplasma phagocytophilum str. ApMUC09]KJV67151.1 hypothetical protein APHNP_1473 [Anaplasma phagocytophilum str. ApNP]